MKKFTLCLLVLSAAAMLSGCKGAQKETEAPTEPPTTEAVTEQTEPVTEAPTETEKEDSMNRTRSLKGLVKASGTDTLTIQTERGKELEFSIAGADIQLSSGIQTGNNVTILYKGTISGTDTSAARVLMVKDLDAGETPVTEGELQTENEVADPDAGAGSIGGTIEDLNTDRIVIVADDGESYYFSLYEASVNLVNGMKQGNYVTVDYVGDIYGPDLVPATSVTDNDPASGDATVKPGPSAQGEYSYVNGTVEDCSMTTITILADDGTELSFDTSNATYYYSNGIMAGSYITVEYTGTLDGVNTTGVTAAAVYDYTESGADTGDGAEGAEDGAVADAEDGGAADEGAVDDGAGMDDGVSMADDGAAADAGDGQADMGSDGAQA
ncbi:MAG: hypothetical protein Q4C50_05295 [Eubacteriales bacterium]|nr:hypothetical protein [Eubacteriales bacterium]